MKHDEQQAFPSPPTTQHRYGPMGERLNDVVWRGFPGMTLREYYAGLAMQGMIASSYDTMTATLVSEAVYISDALIAELQRKADDDADV